jgi:GH24 family phage-related lysozyme (muramidase)
MASSKIPGPLKAKDDSLDAAEAAAWPHSLGRALRHHVPGPVGFHRDPSWLAGIRVAPIHIDYEELFRDLKRWEGNVPYMYLDSVGLVTVGIGNLLRTLEAAQRLAFIETKTGRPASDAEIANAFFLVSQKKAGLHWTKYKLEPSIEISEETSRDLALIRLRNEFIPGIRRKFPKFDDYPRSAQRFMVDMAYNGGVRYFAKRQMVGPIERRQWLDAVPLVPTKGNPRRNAWRETMLRQAAAEDGT